ncbi:MAG: hypothetical protein R2719_02955 [Micropruina sp.]
MGRSRDASTGRSGRLLLPAVRRRLPRSARSCTGDLVANQYRSSDHSPTAAWAGSCLARDKNVSDRWVVLKGLLNTGDADTLKATISGAAVPGPGGASADRPRSTTSSPTRTTATSVMEYVGGRSLKQLLKQRMESNEAPTTRCRSTRRWRS